MVKKTDTRPFHFKQFSLTHHRSTMKVGTDAVVLSAWVDLKNVSKVLDVGTGSGIIALMLAARGIKQIDAIELDKTSSEEAKENFINSPFKGEFNIFNEDFKTFKQNDNYSFYDLIISNPPFFINDMLPAEEHRKQARHANTLTYYDLITGATKLLNNGGKLAVVLPYLESRFFIKEAEKQGFSVKRKLIIFPKPCKEPNRINIELTLHSINNPVIEKFVIRDENGKFSSQYKNLLELYYLNITD